MRARRTETTGVVCRGNNSSLDDRIWELMRWFLAPSDRDLLQEDNGSSQTYAHSEAVSVERGGTGSEGIIDAASTTQDLFPTQPLYVISCSLPL